ncbi:hypothetical protein ACP70R_031034 [Stipagrostis hirtigluma subsp. patula]
MGALAPMSFFSAKRERRRWRCRRQIRRHGGSIASVATTKCVQCQHEDSSQGGKASELYLPEDILRHIHGLMPLRDAARAACVSHTFMRSWRHHPHLTFTEETLGLNKNPVTQDDITGDFINKIMHILQNHDGTGVKALELELFRCSSIDSSYLDGWLHIAVTPGIERLTIMFPSDSNARYSNKAGYNKAGYNCKAGYNSKAGYDFPCSLLFDRGGDSVRYLHLSQCAFRPTVDLGCLRSLSQLHLCFVRITGDELELFLSKSFVLESLRLSYCDEIIRMKIPCLLQRLSNLQANIVSYALTNLLSVVPNVETFTIHSRNEITNTPMVPGKFLHLKYLNIHFVAVTFSPAYDYFSLVSFLDASPSLETFFLSVTQRLMEHDSIFGESVHLRQLPEHRHESLKSVKISGFCSAKSMVELTCHILENASSLECLTLDTTNGAARCSASKSGKCLPMWKDVLIEAHKALLAISTCIEGKVPLTVKLNVVEPCTGCHAVEL